METRSTMYSPEASWPRANAVQMDCPDAPVYSLLVRNGLALPPAVEPCFGCDSYVVAAYQLGGAAL